MSNSSKIIIITAAIIIAVAAGFGAGFITSQAISGGVLPFIGNSPTTDPRILSEKKVIDEAWDLIKREYVEPSKLASDNISASAIQGIIAALQDPYTTYFSPDEYNIVQSQFQGAFDGIGAVVGLNEGKLTIASVFKGTPAEAAGIKAGDVIMEINGESTEGMTVDIAVSKIRGPAGTPVTLLILHKDGIAPVTVTVTRARIDVPSVEFEMRGDIALISIYQFTNRTEDELAAVMPKLEQENAQGIILDLRNNPGGILGIVIQVASHFITDGVIVSVRSNQGVVETYEAVKRSSTTNLPMVVLINENSASGSEVLSGALQDQQRAIIAGTTTYGKGSVNVLHPLSDGSGIYITTSRWLTPNGRLIEGNGIVPDIELEMTGEEQIQWAIDFLQKH